MSNKNIGTRISVLTIGVVVCLFPRLGHASDSYRSFSSFRIADISFVVILFSTRFSQSLTPQTVYYDPGDT